MLGQVDECGWSGLEQSEVMWKNFVYHACGVWWSEMDESRKEIGWANKRVDECGWGDVEWSAVVWMSSVCHAVGRSDMLCNGWLLYWVRWMSGWSGLLALLWSTKEWKWWVCKGKMDELARPKMDDCWVSGWRLPTLKWRMRVKSISGNESGWAKKEVDDYKVERSGFLSLEWRMDELMWKWMTGWACKEVDKGISLQDNN